MTWTRQRDKVAIVGYTQHQLEAPWTNPEWDIWGLNDLYEWMDEQAKAAGWGDMYASGRLAWFQLHRENVGGQPFKTGARDPKHMEWLKAAKCPIWMWKHHPEFPSSQAYPIHEVLARFPRAYFNNSISWELALAIHLGYRTIGVFGVDMALDGVTGESEYSHQRPSVEYFIGMAEGMGIEVVLPETSELCRAGYLYGWDNVMPARQKMVDRLLHLKAQEQETADAYNQQKWQLAEVRGYLTALRGGKFTVDDIPKLEQEEVAMSQQLGFIERNLHQTRGALHDVEWFLRNYFPGDGAFQDVARTPRAVIHDETTQAPVIPLLGDSPVTPPPSDGQRNRVKARLAKVKG